MHLNKTKPFFVKLKLNLALSNYEIRSDATIETPTTNKIIAQFIKENDHLFEIEMLRCLFICCFI